VHPTRGRGYYTAAEMAAFGGTAHQPPPMPDRIDIHVHSHLDGREVAKTTVSFMRDELLRLGGSGGYGI
jgi:hypothetical protein